VSLVLADLGYRVLEAGSARDAWDLLETGEQPDLMLVDYAMPEVSGADFAKTLRQTHSAPSLLFMTGYADTEKLTEQAGPELVLKKPFTATELAAAIRAALRTSDPGDVISLKPKRH
jgi:CheY-like chemotaxis protein